MEELANCTTPELLASIRGTLVMQREALNDALAAVERSLRIIRYVEARQVVDPSPEVGGLVYDPNDRDWDLWRAQKPRSSRAPHPLYGCTDYERQVQAEAAAARARGLKWADVAAHLNAMGLRTRKGRVWNDALMDHYGLTRPRNPRKGRSAGPSRGRSR